MITKAIIGLIAVGLALAFYAVPIVKLKSVALIIVVGIGVAMMFYNFYEEMRKGDDD